MVFEMVDEVPMRKAPSIRARALSPIGEHAMLSYVAG